ncbi:NADH dehydrogenase subunit 6 (mitochondrion) [Mya arenaria]|uniref:NADH dehydrogenase subunit 6 n=1 Tax=Mya arenaria TaxID=6604 RepID=A0A076JDD0_MYAAR|nr:NADH dehydrogenase subunit 6 [Mya arenaria]AII72399.1 NADH dehydrogenase subunit 6 [Mya arenaria]UJM44277.1 NADH dehydrogenase subunit 6 [Mya arenaria]
MMVYMFLLVLGALLWYILSMNIKEFVLVWLLMSVSLSVTLMLYLMGLSFLSFCVYMGAVAGVVVLVAYCVALTSFVRRIEKVGVVEAGLGLSVRDVFILVFIGLVCAKSFSCVPKESLFLPKFFLKELEGGMDCLNLSLHMEWGMLIIYLSVHLLLVMVCSVTMVSVTSGPLARSKALSKN